MRDDPPLAAQRLSATLPCRTHYAPEHVSSHWRSQQKANHMRAVRINGTVYESLTEAARQIGTHRDAIRRMIVNGEARYLDARPKNPGVGKGGAQGHAISINGKEYASMSDARAVLHVSIWTIYKWIDEGKALRL